MSDSNEVLNTFMPNKNKEALGEKSDNIEEKNDNFLAEADKMKQTFSGESSSAQVDKAYLYARKILNILLTLPILIGGITSFFYLLFKMGPYLLDVFKKLLISFFK